MKRKKPFTEYVGLNKQARRFLKKGKFHSLPPDQFISGLDFTSFSLGKWQNDKTHRIYREKTQFNTWINDNEIIFTCLSYDIGILSEDMSDVQCFQWTTTPEKRGHYSRKLGKVWR